MTRAQQTISVLLLVSSVWQPDSGQRSPLANHCLVNSSTSFSTSVWSPSTPPSKRRSSQLYVTPPAEPPPSYEHFRLTRATLRNQLPFYALICFGCYLLGRLGLAILTFNDVPEAHRELQKEIEQARTELRKVNVDVD